MHTITFCKYRKKLLASPRVHLVIDGTVIFVTNTFRFESGNSPRHSPALDTQTCLFFLQHNTILNCNEQYHGLSGVQRSIRGSHTHDCICVDL